MRQLKLIAYLWRYFGLSWLIFRLVYALKLRWGCFKNSTPAATWDDVPLASLLIDSKNLTDFSRSKRPPFFFDPNQIESYTPILKRYDALVEEPSSGAAVAALKRGEIPYYGHTWQPVGRPPRWHTNPFTGQQTPSDQHWSQISDFGQGDIKIIWEPSRFSFVFDLVRAYWRSEDETIPALFWEWVIDWRTNNPPNMGANWKCGQETTFRVMAWCFGLYGFINASASTAERVNQLVQMIAVSADRIEKNIAYALSQSNNHGLSEAVGLWTIGLLFPELSGAERWRKTGQKFLEAQTAELFYKDGGFSQHSFNYQRVALHDLLWAAKLGDLNGFPMGEVVRERMAAAIDLLIHLQEGDEGQLPNYGQNDGALILPLTSCGASDYRPLLQTLSLYIHGRLLFPPGPWDEEALWLLGPKWLTGQEPRIPEKSAVFTASESGCITLRRPEGMVFTRCGSLRHRPGQDDMLHVDLWWRGQNIAIDPGTYSYNDPEPWGNPLAKAAYHNKVTAGGADHMDRYGRFLWFPWLNGQGAVDHQDAAEVGWRGSMVTAAGDRWQREINGVDNGTWIISDWWQGAGPARPVLHWLLADWLYEQGEKHTIVLNTPKGAYEVTLFCDVSAKIEVVRADLATPHGWWAPSYHLKEPALSVTITASQPTARFVSLFSPAGRGFTLDNKGQLNQPSLNL